LITFSLALSPVLYKAATLADLTDDSSSDEEHITSEHLSDVDDYPAMGLTR